MTMSCGESEKSLKSLSNSPEYNMLAAEDNVSAIWSMDILGIVEESAVKELQFGMLGLAAQSILAKISDKDESGIDFSGNSYFVARHNEEYQYDYSFTYYPVLNRAKVYGTIQSSIGMMLAGVHNSRDNYDTYVTEAGVAGAWDDTHFVMIFAGENRLEDELVAIAISVLQSRYEDASENTRIREFMTLDDDISCLIDLEKTVKVGQAESQLSTDDALIEAYKDGFVVGHSNFNNGEMIFSADVDAENLKASEFNVFGATGVARDLIDFVSTDHSINVGGANLKVNNLVDLIKEIQFEDESVYQLLTRYGVSDEHLKRAVTGEFAFSMIDVRIPEGVEEKDEDAFEDFFAEESYTKFIFDVQAQPEVIVGLRLSNVDVFREILNSIPDAQKKNGVIQVQDIYIAESDGKALITTSFEVAEKVASGQSLNTAPMEFSAGDIAQPFFTYFNTNYSSYSDKVKAFMGERLSAEDIDRLWMAEKISASANFDHFEFRVVMKDKSQNALKVFVHAIYSALMEV